MKPNAERRKRVLECGDEGGRDRQHAGFADAFHAQGIERDLKSVIIVIVVEMIRYTLHFKSGEARCPTNRTFRSRYLSSADSSNATLLSL